MKKIFLLSLISFILINYAHAQYNIETNNGQVITACTGDFYDNASGNYAANVNQTVTFKSNSTTTTHMKVNFNSFDVDPSDTLYIYDGLNVSAPLIGKYNNNHPLSAGQNSIQASIYNASGALTFRFWTSASNQAAGWFASIVCTPACQKIFASLDSLLTIPHPIDSNYVDACMGDSLTFTGKGTFPENNILYNQQLNSCIFNWDFGDGSTGTGKVIKHKFTIRRGYDIMLKITDSIGCTSTNAIGVRVRMAGFPGVHIIPLSDMCSGDSINLKAGYMNNSNIMLEPMSFVQSSKQSFDSTMFLPDGPICLPGVYNTSVVFNNFSPGLTITSSANILAICVNMEHSYCGDLGFKIFCPNGQNVQLDPNTHSGGAYLGEPYGGNNHHSYDNGCLPANNPYGVGWNYCWSEFYPNGGHTMDWLSTNACTNALCSGSTGSSIDSTDQVAHLHYIMPQNPLSGLIGCPLNGTWNIQIVDDYGSDNGYIFHWDIQLQANLMPVNWTYNVKVDSVKFAGPYVTKISDSIAKIHPMTGGNFLYPITLYDDFGCKWDTSTNLVVVQTPSVHLGNDTSFCEGATITLNAGNTGSYFQWNYADINGSTNQNLITKDSILSSGNPFIYNYVVHVSNLNNNIQCTAMDSIKVTVNPNPSINFFIDTNDACAPIKITFNNTSTPTNATYLWNFGDGTTSTAYSPVHTFTAGNFDLILKVTTIEGCKADFNSTNYIHSYPMPNADFTWNPTIGVLQDPTIHFSDKTVPTNTGFSNTWFFGDNTSDFIKNPSHTFPGVGFYNVTMIVTSDWGCVDTAKYTIQIINDSLTFPNIITPNGDGYNDKFVIKGLESGAYPNNKLVIFNRWGKKVYETINYNNDFDGNGLPDGVYYYIFTAKGILKEMTHKSSLEILR